MKTLKVKENNELKVYEFEGDKFIILSRLAEAINVSKSDVYNAAARMREYTDMYVRIIPISDILAIRPVAKCINIKGLNILFKKLEKKMDKNDIDTILNFFEVSETEESKDSERKEGAVIVEFNPTQETATDLSIKEFEESVIENNTTVVEENADSVNDATEVLDGMIRIIQEHKELKIEVSNLKQHISELEVKLAVTANAEEVESLKKENEFLRNELEKTKMQNTNMLNKASLIKNYIMNNK